MKSYINIHSHYPAQENEWAVVNMHQHFVQWNHHQPVSMGLHPWYIRAEDWKEEFTSLLVYCRMPQMIAIGECGIDKICETPLGLQVLVFEAQAALAKEINKPLIIHCVKAYDEVLQVLKTLKGNPASVFHGFHKNLQVAKRILDAGHYLSFGKSLLEKQTQEIFSSLPMERLFLETDDKNISIIDLYELAAATRKIRVEDLSSQLIQNTLAVFNISIET